MMAMDSSILDTTLNAFGLVTAIVCLYDGTQRIRRAGISKRAAACAAIGVIYFVMYAAYSFWSIKFVNETVAMLSKGVTIPQITEDWGKNFSRQERFENSYLIAKMAYYDHGQLRHYFDQAGTKVLFAPSEDQIREREKNVAVLAKLSYLAELNSNTTLHWVIIALATALFGVIEGRRKSSNISLDADE
jgi:hypothetical protein